MSDLKVELHHLRQDYKSASLLENEVESHPLKQFENWFSDAQNARLLEPNAMTLATADKNGMPTARIVLLKEINDNGFIFFTNYLSQKGAQIAENPQVSLVFFWPELERQVRIQGIVKKIDDLSSEVYFRSRPVGSQLGAIVSEQSQTIPDRFYLEERLKSLSEQYKNQSIPKPEQWGGYCVIPSYIEFWQGRSNRLHDRILYKLNESGEWKISRLAP